MVHILQFLLYNSHWFIQDGTEIYKFKVLEFFSEIYKFVSRISKTLATKALWLIRNLGVKSTTWKNN